MDTLRRLARERHFYTADVHLGGYGQVLLIGDAAAVERVLAVLNEHDAHELVEPDPNLRPADPPKAGA